MKNIKKIIHIAMENELNKSGIELKFKYKGQSNEVQGIFIDIVSSKVFLSLVIMALIIIGLSYVVGEQRRSISQYKENDLKYRYIKMQGQINEENLYRLEQQFRYSDSNRIIRKQVENYEELVKEQVEKLEQAKKSREEIEKIFDKVQKSHLVI